MSAEFGQDLSPLLEASLELLHLRRENRALRQANAQLERELRGVRGAHAEFELSADSAPAMLRPASRIGRDV